MVKEPIYEAKVSPPLTCLLCNELFKNATTVVECMHTFCRECIEKKIIDENLRHCPVCNVDLGCYPLDKLKEDCNLQGLREQIFPKKVKHSKAPENVPSVALTRKSKEGSAPSLKANARKSKRVVTSTKSKQNSSQPESSKQTVPKKTSAGSAELCKKGKADMSKPLTSLVEATRKIKISNKSPMLGSAVIPVHMDSSDNDSQVNKVQVKKHSHTGGKKESDSPKLKRLQLQGTKERTVKFIGDLNLPPPPVIGSGSESSHKFGNLPSQHEIGSTSKSNKAVGAPVWLSLVSSEDRKIGARLPQITTSFIRLDGNLPVSYIEKYVTTKLGLPSDAEVEIQLWGQPVFSLCKLQNLVETWLQTMPKNEKIPTSVGSSADDFVMVLSYGLKG